MSLISGSYSLAAAGMTGAPDCLVMEVEKLLREEEMEPLRRAAPTEAERMERFAARRGTRSCLVAERKLRVTADIVLQLKRRGRREMKGNGLGRLFYYFLLLRDGGKEVRESLEVSARKRKKHGRWR